MTIVLECKITVGKYVAVMNETQHYKTHFKINGFEHY